MPIFIRSIDHEHHELDAIAYGPINYAQIEKHLIEERNIEGLAYKEFIDGRDAGLAFALSPTEIRKIVALVRAHGSPANRERRTLFFRMFPQSAGTWSYPSLY
jgi:hypothetical protein